MTASWGFRFSVNGWIKLDTDSFVYAERHQDGMPYSAIGY